MSKSRAGYSLNLYWKERSAPFANTIYNISCPLLQSSYTTDSLVMSGNPGQMQVAGQVPRLNHASVSFPMWADASSCRVASMNAARTAEVLGRPSKLKNMKMRSVGLIDIPKKGDVGATWAHSESLSASHAPVSNNGLPGGGRPRPAAQVSTSPTSAD